MAPNADLSCVHEESPPDHSFWMVLHGPSLEVDRLCDALSGMTIRCITRRGEPVSWRTYSTGHLYDSSYVTIDAPDANLLGFLQEAARRVLPLESFHIEEVIVWMLDAASAQGNGQLSSDEIYWLSKLKAAFCFTLTPLEGDPSPKVSA